MAPCGVSPVTGVKTLPVKSRVEETPDTVVHGDGVPPIKGHPRFRLPDQRVRIRVLRNSGRRTKGRLNTEKVDLPPSRPRSLEGPSPSISENLPEGTGPDQNSHCKRDWMSTFTGDAFSVVTDT